MGVVSSVCGGGAAAPKAFLTPEPLDLLVADAPPLTTGTPIRVAVDAAVVEK